MGQTTQCGRTFPHLAHETTAGDCPGLASDRINAALLTIAEALGLQPAIPRIPDASADYGPLEELMEGSEIRGDTADADPWAERPSYDDLQAGLQTIVQHHAGGCERSPSGLGSCWRNGYKVDAEYGADKACTSCIAWQVLRGLPLPSVDDPTPEDHAPRVYVGDRRTVTFLGDHGDHVPPTGVLLLPGNASIDPSKTVGECQMILGEHGADAIAVTFTDRKPTGLRFMLNGQSYILPLDVDGMASALQAAWTRSCSRTSSWTPATGRSARAGATGSPSPPAVATVDEQTAADRLRDLTDRLGYGDGVTEPMAPNDVIVAGVEQDRADAREWHEHQAWRNECAAAGCPDDQDCRDHDPHWGWTPYRAPRPTFATDEPSLPEGWSMLVVGGDQPGGPDVVLAGWTHDDRFHQYADTETIVRSLVSYLQDGIHV
jgi:hypothetical protein